MASCPQCGLDNRDTARYCVWCGGLLSAALACSYCGTPNRPGSRFCHRCGQPQLVALLAGAETGRIPAGVLLHRHYHIQSRIAKGGMGAVYRATDTLDSTTKAVKEMSALALPAADRAGALTSFYREARLLATLRHPNLPAVMDVFAEGGRHFLVMELVEGETLEKQVQKQGRPGEAELREWARQLCEVLDYLHRQQPPIIYRDLKPSNIMIQPDGTLRLIDFGIARFHTVGKAKDTQLMGTPGFAPPEQYGKGQTDARSDVYALGVTLLTLLTGHDPESSPFQMPHAHSLDPGMSDDLADAIFTATRPKPEDRFQTVSDLLHSIAAGALPGTASTPPMPIAPPVPPAPGVRTIACANCGSMEPADALYCQNCGEMTLDLDASYSLVCPDCGEVDYDFVIPDFGEPACAACEREFTLEELAVMRYGDMAGSISFGCPSCGEQDDALEVPELGLVSCANCGAGYGPDELAALDNGALGTTVHRFVCPACKYREQDWAIPRFGSAVCPNCGEIFPPARLAAMRRRP